MSLAVSSRLKTAFAPPRYLDPPHAGMELSASGVKAVRLAHDRRGITLESYVDVPLPAGAVVDGEIIDRKAVIQALATAAQAVHISTTSAALPEAKSYIFETTAFGVDKEQWRTSVEQHIEEFIPLPQATVTFDVVRVGTNTQKEAVVVGVGSAYTVVADTLSVFEEAGIRTRSLEAENFATARALLPRTDQSTVLIIDIGKTTTKIAIVSHGIPRFATTIGIGGHALTLAIQKYFNVGEEEAVKIKTERGIAPALGNKECLEAMLSTVSAIRDELSNRLNYWQAKATPGGTHEPVTRALLSGGNATLRGLQEYLESSLRIPVSTGDVFTNFASREVWLPPLAYRESLVYATAIGLALYDHYYE